MYGKRWESNEKNDFVFISVLVRLCKNRDVMDKIRNKSIDAKVRGGFYSSSLFS